MMPKRLDGGGDGVSQGYFRISAPAFGTMKNQKGNLA